MTVRPAQWAVLPSAACALAMFAGAHANADIAALRSAWESANSELQYDTVADDLLAYRVERYAKTPELDYMIATSLCRVSTRKPDGVRVFEWILANYELNDEGRAIVETERSSCGPSTAPASPPEPQQLVVQLFPAQGGMSGVHGKLYYWLNNPSAALGVEPMAIVRQMTAAELSARLFLRTDVAGAVSALRQRLGSSFTVVGTDYFVLATSAGQSEAQLRQIAGKLEQFMSFYAAAYALRLPSHLVTVYLVPDVDRMRNMAEQLHGLSIPPSVIGYSFREDLSMVGIVPGDVMGTLAHEMFHLMVRDQHGDLPPWLEEGIASLYEVSNISGKYVPANQFTAGDAATQSETDVGSPPMVGSELAVAGIPNWRGCVLKKLWIEHMVGDRVDRPTIEHLAGMDWRAFNQPEGNGEEAMAQQAINFAAARYLMLYLQDHEQLLFKAFAALANRDPLSINGSPADDARARLADVLGPLQPFDDQFKNWLTDQVSQQDCG